MLRLLKFAMFWERAGRDTLQQRVTWEMESCLQFFSASALVSQTRHSDEITKLTAGWVQDCRQGGRHPIVNLLKGDIRCREGLLTWSEDGEGGGSGHPGHSCVTAWLWRSQVSYPRIARQTGGSDSSNTDITGYTPPASFIWHKY